MQVLAVHRDHQRHAGLGVLRAGGQLQRLNLCQDRGSHLLRLKALALHLVTHAFHQRARTLGAQDLQHHRQALHAAPRQAGRAFQPVAPAPCTQCGAADRRGDAPGAAGLHLAQLRHGAHQVVTTRLGQLVGGAQFLLALGQRALVFGRVCRRLSLLLAQLLDQFGPVLLALGQDAKPGLAQALFIALQHLLVALDLDQALL